MLESKNNNHVTKSYDWTNMWKNDGRLGYVTNKSCDLDYERIGDDDH
jgi:hypothetical protein